jgi:thiamine biosynthesis protein ThiI
VKHVTLIRYDEIGLKGRNRRFFESKLRHNIARSLGLPAGAIARERGRLFLQEAEGLPPDGATLRALSRTFGVRSFSPAVHVEGELGAIEQVVLRLAHQAVDGGALTFAVDSRRSQKSFTLTSLELNIRLGRLVQDHHPGLAVNLGAPDFTLHVEIRGSGAYVYVPVHAGPGGLPVGSAGRALLLLSGGIDSPVAGWMALKRGLALDSVHFHSPPYTSAAARDKAVSIARELAGWRGRSSRIYLVSITAAQRALAAALPERVWTLALRRFMLRIAEALARRSGYGALVTGDSLGQVASQTLENLAAVDRAVEVSVLRPLVGFDKAEIINQARRIGTYTLSVQPHPDCCVVFAPRHPETRARAEELTALESRLSVADLVDAAVASVEVVEVQPQPPRARQPAASLAPTFIASATS